MRNYFFFFIYLLLRPQLLKIFLKGIYLPVYIQYEWLKKYQINTFIDIGALDGNVCTSIHSMFPNTMIFAFEPIKEKVELIKTKINPSKLIIENLALSDHIGKTTFYEYDYTGASSLLQPEPENSHMFGKNITKSYPTQITTLDDYFNTKKLNGPIILKIDTQGTEDLILKGGKKFLQQVSIIIIETSFIKFYKNQCSFDDIYELLTKMGFEYKGRVLDSDFYPVFAPAIQENSVFIKKGK